MSAIYYALRIPGATPTEPKRYLVGLYKSGKVARFTIKLSEARTFSRAQRAKFVHAASHVTGRWVLVESERQRLGGAA